MKRILLILVLCTTLFAQYSKPPLGSLPDWGESINRGLVAWWIMNEGVGSHINDISGNNNHGTLQNTTSWDGGQFGHVLTFSGANDYVDCGGSPTLKITGDWTIAAWIKPADFKNGATNWHIINSETFEASGILFRIDGGTSKLFVRTNGGGSAHQSRAVNEIPKDIWVFVLATQNGTSVDFYADSVLLTKDLTGTHTGTVAASINLTMSKATQPFDGQIDNVMIWDRALLSTEIQQVYTQPFKGIVQ